jgi:hypothetical protein
MGRRAVTLLVAGAVTIGTVGAASPSASAVGDTSAPTVTSVHAIGSSVVAGDPIVVSYAASDDSSGVTTVYATMTGPSGVTVTLRGVGGDYLSIDARGGPLAGVVPVGAPPGVYTLTDVLVYDAVGNSTDYRQGSATSTPAGSPAVLDLSTVAVTVTQPGAADVTAPALTAFGMASSIDRRPGEFVTWSFVASDARSPITGITVFVRTPSAITVNTFRGGGLLTGQRISFWLPTDAQLGTWTVTGVRLRDSSGNERDYAPSGTGTQSGQPSLTGPVFTGMTFDVVAGAPRADPLRVFDSYPDPVVRTKAGSTLVVRGATVTVSGTVTFLGAAVPNPALAAYAETSAGRRFLGVVHGTAAGAFSTRLVVGPTTVVRMRFLGSDRTAASAPALVAGGLRIRTALRQTLAIGASARTHVVAAVVAPRRGGVLVTLWRSVNRGRWVVLATVRTRSNGVALVRVRSPRAASVRYLWTAPYDGTYLAARSLVLSRRV